MVPIKEFEHLKIPLEAIGSATNNFADYNCVGRGGFGKVYNGEIVHSNFKTMVAFKCLDRQFGQGDPEFWKEIMMLSLYKHENIVALLGYSDDSGEEILAYEYASKKSLDLYLDSVELTWVRRLKICIGAARGLAYLHKPARTQLRILHRDIKSANILLDENWNAKISDLGLSKFAPAPANNQFTYLISNAVGTPGYCDPLYAETYLLTKESDVYSFGVVLFEVLCGRLCFGNDKRQPLIGLVRKHYEAGNIGEIIFWSMKDEINPDALKLFTGIAYECLMSDRKHRPSMSRIVGSLESALEYQCPTPKPAGTLKVNVLRTIGIIRSKNPFAASNYYLILELTNPGMQFTENMKSTVKHHMVNPVWNEEFNLYSEDFENQCLYIYVNNVVSVEKHAHMGYAILDLKRISPDVRATRYLEINSRSECIGKLEIEVLFKPFPPHQIPTNIWDVIPMLAAPAGTPETGGLLVVRIREACLGDIKDTLHLFVYVVFHGESRNTPIMMNSNHPKWEQEFTFMVEHPPIDEELHLEVISNSWMTLITHRQESVGRVNISLSEVVNKNRTIRLYRLTPSGYHSNWLDVELQWRTCSDQLIGGMLSNKQEKVKFEKFRPSWYRWPAKTY